MRSAVVRGSWLANLLSFSQLLSFRGSFAVHHMFTCSSFVRSDPIHHPRESTDSALWKILHNHHEDFKAGHDEHCEKQYGFYRPRVDEMVEEYQRCGDLHGDRAELVEGALPGSAAGTPTASMNSFGRLLAGAGGFARVAIVREPFNSGKTSPTSSSIPFSHRQFVFSIPIMLRVYFKYDPRLPTQLGHCARESLEVFFRASIGLQEGMPGMIKLIHTFGDYTGFHAHLPTESLPEMAAAVSNLDKCG